MIGGRGGLRYISHIGKCRRKGGLVFAPFLSDYGYRVCPFWSGIGYHDGFRGNDGSAWMWSSFQFQMNKKESVICQFEIDWNLFVGVPNLSNDDIICVYINMYGAFCDHLQVWKQAWILEARSENGCGKWHLLVSNRVRIWRTERHIPTRNSQEYPRAHDTLYGEKNELGQLSNCQTSRWCFSKRGKEKFGRFFKWS